VEDPNTARVFTRNQLYFQDRKTDEHHTGTKKTIHHQTNRRTQIKYTGERDTGGDTGGNNQGVAGNN